MITIRLLYEICWSIELIGIIGHVQKVFDPITELKFTSIQLISTNHSLTHGDHLLLLREERKRNTSDTDMSLWLTCSNNSFTGGQAWKNVLNTINACGSIKYINNQYNVHAICHEIGHIIGLNHNFQEATVMSYSPLTDITFMQWEYDVMKQKIN